MSLGAPNPLLSVSLYPKVPMCDFVEVVAPSDFTIQIIDTVELDA